jgi:Na+-translocating ferredoxin:NAD+ oxidoreductase subunit G
MNAIATIGGRLALICVVAASVLGLVNAFTAPRIAEVKEKQLQEALRQVKGDFSAGEEIPVENHTFVQGFYPLSAADSSIGGYIMKLNAVGYGGDIEMLASFTSNGEVLAVAVMDNLETPGLGKLAEKPAYMDKFVGKGDGLSIPVTKQELPQEKADSISGASITFMGIAQALLQGSEFAKTIGD